MIVALLMAQAIVSSVGQTGGITAESVGTVNQTYVDTLTGQAIPASDLVWLKYVWQPKERFYMPMAWFASEKGCKAASTPPGRGPGGGVTRTFCGPVGLGQRALSAAR